MTIGERINLHRCGYTRAEIDALAAAEKEELQQAGASPEESTDSASPQPEAAPAAPQPEAATAAPQPNKEILDAINNLAAVIQSRNVNTQQQPQPSPQTVNDLINTL